MVVFSVLKALTTTIFASAIQVLINSQRIEFSARAYALVDFSAFNATTKEREHNHDGW